jgi:hypothetical protein
MDHKPLSGALAEVFLKSPNAARHGGALEPVLRRAAGEYPAGGM